MDNISSMSFVVLTNDTVNTIKLQDRKISKSEQLYERAQRKVYLRQTVSVLIPFIPLGVYGVLGDLPTNMVRCSFHTLLLSSGLFPSVNFFQTCVFKVSLFVFYACVCTLSACLCTRCIKELTELGRKYQIPWKYSYKLMWVLGTKHCSFGRAQRTKKGTC